MPTLYAFECETPGHFYVGTTIQPLQDRLEEHRQHIGCRWTQKHGYARLLESCFVSMHHCHHRENDLWMDYARQYGPHVVRGGETVIVDRHTDTIPDWLLPTEFGGERIVEWGSPTNVTIWGSPRNAH